MKTTITRGACLMATLALSLNTSFGQEEEKKGWADKASPESLSPFNVIGTKAEAPALKGGLRSPASIESTPQSLSIMSGDQIKAQGLKSVGDIIDYTPGVTNSQGEGHRDAAVIRGMRTTQDFYRDGVRDDVQYYRPLYNVEQVEILRGPNALLSGFGGAYGLINRVSKKGVLGETFNTASASIDTFGETVFELDSNHQLDENKALRINMFGENLDNHRDFYYGDSFGVTPTLRANVAGGVLDLSYEYLNQERFIDRGIPTGADGKPVASLKDYVFGDATENYSTHKAHIFRAIFEHELSDTLSGRFSASYSDHDKMYQNLYVGSYNAAASTVELAGYRDTTQRETAIFSYDIEGEFETGGIVHNVLAGVEYTSTDNNNDRYYSDWSDARLDGRASGTGTKQYYEDVFSIARPMAIRHHVGTNSDGNTTVNNYTHSNAYHDDTHGELSVLSIYLHDEIALMDALDLILGVRFDGMDYDVANIKGGTTLTDSDDTISPRAGLIFDVTEEASLYVSYSESFQQIKGDQYASLNAYDSKSDHNTFENTEFGVRYDLPVGLSLSAAFFKVEANKPQTNDNGGSFFMEKSDTTGFELQLSGTLTDRWFLSAGYTSLDASDENGARLREAPEDAFSLWNNYLVSDRLAVNLGIIYQGESQIGSSATPVLPDYTRVDVGASYGLTENTRVQVNVENLTDELYFPHSHSTHQASVGAPINATFSITSKF